MIAGTRLGPYEILAPLGSGGMGEVYRARDTRLGRDVAVKILPAEFANDPSRRQRFELESRAVAALNHPNIVAVYDVGEGYFVSELVDGEPLRGARPGLRKTIEIALQIASGLAAAHAAGIVHRDLKPDNILLTRDGRPKILDFGLAKVHSQHAAAATETVTVHTDPGAVMGTVGYMSPEQVRGMDTDHRSDIFSFGVILYELFTGRRAFQGETSIDTMQAILRQDPPELPETVPAFVRQIVAHCLEKDPANRFQSSKDLGFALSQSGIPAGTAPVLARRRNWPRWAAAGLALIALGMLAGVFLLRPPAPASWSSVVLGGPDIAMTPRVSPDGRTLALVAMVGERTQVAIMKPEAGDWAILTRETDRGVTIQLSWAPDGNRIYFDRATDVPGGIYSVPVLGGDPRLVLENAVYPEALPDGSLMVARPNARRELQVFRFWPETGKLQEFGLRVGLGNYPPIRVFPDGREAVVFGYPEGSGGQNDTGLYIVNLTTGRVRHVPAMAAYPALAVTRNGMSVLASNSRGRLLMVHRDGRSPPRSLFTVTSPIWSIDGGPDGGVYVDLVERPGALLRFPAHGGHAQQIATDPSVVLGYHQFALLADGRAVWAQSIAGRRRLVVLEAGKDALALVNTTEQTSLPAAPAGSGLVAFIIDPEKRRDIGIASIVTGRVERRIPFDKGFIQSMTSSPDGRTLYLAAAGDIWAVPSAGGIPARFRAGDAVAVDPEGRYLVVGIADAAKTRLFRVPLHGGAEREISMTGPHRPFPCFGSNSISRDGRLLVGLASPDSWFTAPGIIDLATGRVTRIANDFQGDYCFMSWTPEGGIMASAVGLRSSIRKFKQDDE